MKVNPSQTVYIVGSSSGRYDDYSYSIKAAFLSLSLAKKYVELKNNQVRRLKAMIGEDWEEKWLADEAPYNHRFYGINELNDDYSIQEFQTTWKVRD